MATMEALHSELIKRGIPKGISKAIVPAYK